jgi:alpha-L-arabinofuranosidase
LTIQLEDTGGRVLAGDRITEIGTVWKKHELKFRSTATETNARLVVLATEPGAVDVDMVSLFPEKTFKGRRNGLRADLAQAFADMKPGFLRFPGGCIVEGKDFDNMYRWKDTIGDVAERKQNWNLWQDRNSPQYSQTYGLGFFEYFQFAEDIGAEPVPVVNAGMCCQARRGRHVPLDQLGPFIQDALDLIEFANGPVTSDWGAKRAAMGHPKPFNLKFLAIGNEQWHQEYFDRYDLFLPVLKAKHPEIQYISTSGPLADDALWRFAWDKFKSGTPADVVDEHYYVAPQWLLENVDRYASYDRKGPKIFVGEFAGHDRGRHNNLRSALSEAAYMTGLQRNADVVIMSSYAPLLAKVGHVQWRPDLIWFDNTRLMLTPNYHAQALFAQNRPDVVLPTSVESPLIKPPKAAGRIGVGSWNTEVEYKDIKVVAADGRTLFESDFSDGMEGWNTAGGDWKVVDGALRQSAIVENARAVVGDPSWSNYTLTLKARKLSGQEGFLILYETGDIASPVWWNLGGWNNSDHALQGAGMPEQRMPGRIETDRWYDIKIESSETGVKGWLDGKLLQEGSRRPVPSLYAVAGATGADKPKEMVLSIVNFSSEPRETDVKLNGVSRLAKTARLTLLTSGSPDDVNTLEEPGTVAPVTRNIEIAGPSFSRVFPPYSLSVIRVRIEQ